MYIILLITAFVVIVYLAKKANTGGSALHQGQTSNASGNDLYVPSSIRNLNIPDNQRTFLMTIEWWIAVYEEIARRREETLELELHCEADITNKSHASYALNPNCDLDIKHIPGMKQLTDPNHNAWVELGMPEYDGDDPVLYYMTLENLVNLIAS